MPAMVQACGGSNGERVSAGVQPADHVRREELVPFVGAGQTPLAEFGGLEIDLPIGGYTT